MKIKCSLLCYYRSHAPHIQLSYTVRSVQCKSLSNSLRSQLGFLWAIQQIIVFGSSLWNSVKKPMTSDVSSFVLHCFEAAWRGFRVWKAHPSISLGMRLVTSDQNFWTGLKGADQDRGKFEAFTHVFRAFSKTTSSTFNLTTQFTKKSS